jgi:hypothetical protein
MNDLVKLTPWIRSLNRESRSSGGPNAPVTEVVGDDDVAESENCNASRSHSESMSLLMIIKDRDMIFVAPRQELRAVTDRLERAVP